MKRTLIFVVCIVVSISYIIVLVYSGTVDKLTYDNTIEYSAAVLDTQIVEKEKDISIRIFIDDYFDYVLISPRIASNIDYHKIENISENKRIKFRIESKKSIHINNAKFIDIVSLSIDDDCIFSLDEYNEYTKASATPTRVATIVFLLLLNVSSSTFLLIKRKK